MFLDQRIAESNVSLEPAWSTPTTLVVVVVPQILHMLPRPTKSAGVVNNLCPIPVVLSLLQEVVPTHY